MCERGTSNSLGQELAKAVVPVAGAMALTPLALAAYPVAKATQVAAATASAIAKAMECDTEKS